MQTQEMSLHTEDLSWGLPPGSGGLRGGGLTSLNNNGTSGWGAPPSASAAAATGWGAPPGSSPSSGPGALGSLTNASGSLTGVGASASSSPPSSSGGNQTSAIIGQTNPSSANNNHPGGSNQWGSPSPNRVTSQITNGQPTISGKI